MLVVVCLEKMSATEIAFGNEWNMGILMLFSMICGMIMMYDT